MNNNKSKARTTIAKHTTHGMDKDNAKKDQKIASIGSERNYRQCIKQYYDYCDKNNINPDYRGSLMNLIIYLTERSKCVKQKTLNQIRQAFQLVYKQKLPLINSIINSEYGKRSYELSEVNSIITKQSEKNLITTLISFHSGIRAHEAATILPLDERPISSHRCWDSRRFSGLLEQKIYTVTGKGGLTREISLPLWLSERLEGRRIQPIQIIDREIIYLLNYDIGYGQAWSQSFTSASQKALGFSWGGHGLRHSYSKARLSQLIKFFETNCSQSGCNNPKEDALLVLSQELGHFRPDIVLCYLR